MPQCCAPAYHHLGQGCKQGLSRELCTTTVRLWAQRAKEEHEPGLTAMVVNVMIGGSSVTYLYACAQVLP
jgi:hypothetical protein